MSAQTREEVALQREASVSKIEDKVEHKANLDTRLLHHHRLILQDLPFNGEPALIEDIHRQEIEYLVDKQLDPQYTIRIKRIVGYASTIGNEEHNLVLSAQRANAVYEYFKTAMDSVGVSHADMFTDHISVDGLGESNLPAPTMVEIDNPLNRRVEVIFTLKIELPTPPNDPGPVSKLWKIDFGTAISTGSGDIGSTPASFTSSDGVGTLTMLPDEHNTLAEGVSKPMVFSQFGVSVGLFGKLRKLKNIKKYPKLRRFLVSLDARFFGNNQLSKELIDHLSISTDVVSEGGEFETQEPLSFHDMKFLFFATMSASLTLSAKGEAAMFMLYSDRFFGYTLIYGAGFNAAVPDAEVNFIPAGNVIVEL